MKYLISLHELAEEELNDAIDFYESKSPGLGSLFLQEVERASAMIEQFPESSPLMLKMIRKRTIRRFPYSIMFSVVGNTIILLSIAHQKRRPLFWRHRK